MTQITMRLDKRSREMSGANVWKTTSRIALLLSLAVSFGMMTACMKNPPANGNQRNVNANSANVAQSNSSVSKSSQQPAQSTTGAIEVTSVPPGAHVLLVPTDEGGASEPQLKGLTPRTITDLSPGKYTVDVEHPGYRFFQKEVLVKAGKTVKISAILKKK